MKKIYLDHAATTPLHPEVIKIIDKCQREYFGNPSSIHSFGQETRKIIDDSRQMLAFYLNCSPSEIIFTSGGSESDNLAIKGLITGISSKEILPHVITSSFEHHAVIDTIKEMEAEGKIEATYVQPGNDGIITVESIDKAIRENTVLVSIMYVNNEIGTVQPIREIGKLIEKVNLGRFELEEKIPRIYFHTDAVQAAEFYEMSVEYLHVDLLTFTAHKIYGPKGVGALYAKRGTSLKHQIVGGGQEYKLRAGTENVAGIAGFAKAVELTIKEKADSKPFDVQEFEEMKPLFPSDEATRQITLRDKLVKGIEQKISDVRINGSIICRAPNNVNVTFHNAEGESILLNLDAEGIAASSGSACTSGSLEPSHVLIAIGEKAESAHGSIRFTLGRETSEADIDHVLKVLPGIIKKLRNMSPYK